jgi:hypothetical protein
MCRGLHVSVLSYNFRSKICTFLTVGQTPCLFCACNVSFLVPEALYSFVAMAICPILMQLVACFDFDSFLEAS